jgi:uncharacterized membrane protein
MPRAPSRTGWLLLAFLACAPALWAAEGGAGAVAGWLEVFKADWMPFLGRFHPLVLHLPIGLIFGLACLEFLLLFSRWKDLAGASVLLNTLVFLSSGVAALFGYFLYLEGGYSGDDITLHLYTGIGVAALAFLCWVWRLISLDEEHGGRRFVYRLLLLSNLGLISFTGHLGGNVTHGSTFLTEHLPDPLRQRLVGWGWKSLALPEAAAVPSAGEETLFAAAIQPVLLARCESCHGASKQKGEYRLDTPEHLLQPGESAKIPVVPGRPQDSYLLALIRLPEDDADVMPPEGKARLTPEQIGLIGWWIEHAQASFDLPLAKAAVPPEFAPAIAQARALRKTAPAPSPAEAPPPAPPAASLEARLQPLREAGVQVTPVSQTEAGLSVEFQALGAAAGDASLAPLAAVADEIRWLNLGGTGVTDAGLELVGKFPGLTRLYLDRTAVGDAGIVHLSGLSRLEYLNLYGSRVTDAAVPALGRLAALKKIFLWQTAVTPAGAEALRKLRPELEINLGEEHPEKPAAATPAPADKAVEKSVEQTPPDAETPAASAPPEKAGEAAPASPPPAPEAAPGTDPAP